MPLDADRLERLAIDHALGGLDPDVAALFDAYLATDPDVPRAAAEFAGVAGTARRVLAADRAGGVTQDAPEGLPPFPGRRIGAAAARGRALRLARAGSALAACLILGGTIGAAAARRATTSQPRETQIVHRESESPGARVAHAGPAGPAAHAETAPLLAPAEPTTAGGLADFWSARRLLSRAAESRQTRRTPASAYWGSHVNSSRKESPL